MIISQRRQLASLLSERVKDSADKADDVGVSTAARLLDQVNAEIRELDGEPKPEPTPGAGHRRVFVRG